MTTLAACHACARARTCARTHARTGAGISNIDELVNTFIDAEDQNFSLFNYVNELNNEVMLAILGVTVKGVRWLGCGGWVTVVGICMQVEKLEEQIAEIKQDIEKYECAPARTDARPHARTHAHGRYKGQGGQNDRQRKKLLKDLEDRCAARARMPGKAGHSQAQTSTHVPSVQARGDRVEGGSI